MFIGAMSLGQPTLVELADDSFHDSALSPSDAAVIATIYSDGTVLDNGVVSQTWLIHGAASDYDVYVSHSGDALSSGTLNTWLNLGTGRSYRLDETGIGTKSATLTVQIRNATSLQVLATATFSLSVIVDF